MIFISMLLVILVRFTLFYVYVGRSSRHLMYKGILIKGHPRLLFTAKDPNKIIDKIQSDEIAKELFSALISRCEKYVKSKLPGPRKSGWARYLSSARDAITQMEQCALAYLLTSRTEFLERAKAVINTVLSWDTWVDPDHQKPGVHADLMTAEICRGLAITYDLLYNVLTPKERTDIRKALVERGAVQIYTDSKSGTWWATDRGHNSNWCAVLHGGLGLAGLALLDEEPDAIYWVIQAKKHILVFLDSGGVDGGWAEGLGYWAYGVGYAVLFIDALRRVTGENLYTHPFLNETCYFPVYTVTPDFKGYVNFADSSYTGVRSLISVLLRLSSEYKNPYSQWTALNILRTKGPHPYHIHLSLIWYDPTLKPRNPAGHLPNSKVFRGIRWCIIRTGWNKDALLLATKGGTNDEHHRHFDCGSFILNCFGARLVTDPGAGTYSKEYWSGKDYHVATIGHSTLLINGQGQKKSSIGAMLKSWLFTTWFNYVELELAPVYTGLLEARRTFLVFKDPLMVIIIDWIMPSDPSIKVEWLLHFIGDVRVTEPSIKMNMDNVKLLVKPLIPPKSKIYVEAGEGDYYLRFRIGFRSIVLLYPIKVQDNIVPEIPPFKVHRSNNWLLAELNRSVCVDYILYNPTGSLVGNEETLQSDGHLCILTASYDGSIERLVIVQGRRIFFKEQEVLSASTPITVTLQKTLTGIDGTIISELPSEIKMKIYKGFKTLMVNKREPPYSLSNSYITFKLPKGCQEVDILQEIRYFNLTKYKSARDLLAYALSLVYWSSKLSSSKNVKQAKELYEKALSAYISGDFNSAIENALNSIKILAPIKIERKREVAWIWVIILLAIITITVIARKNISYVCKRLRNRIRSTLRHDCL